jgi:hypothetical protein
LGRLLEDLDGGLLADEDAKPRRTLEVSLAFDGAIILAAVVRQLKSQPFSCRDV